jgi:hypothetical protein
MTTYTWDSSHPATTDTYAGSGAGTVLGSVQSNQAVQARGFDPINGDTINTLVDQMIRVNSTTGRLEKYSVAGASWAALPLAAALGFTAAPIASPNFSGTPQIAGANIATTSIVSGYAPLASPALTGTPSSTTPTVGDSSTKIATTAFVAASYAPLAGPAFTGVPSAPTPTAGDNTTKLATTAFVAASYAPINAPSFTGGVTIAGGLIANGTTSTPITMQVSGTTYGYLQVGTGQCGGFVNAAGTLQALTVDNSGNCVAAGTVRGGSDQRIKTDIQPLDVGEAYDFVRGAKVKTYRLRNGDFRIGVVAQQVEKLGTVGRFVVDKSDTDEMKNFRSIDFSGEMHALMAVVQDMDRRMIGLERR